MEADLRGDACGSDLGAHRLHDVEAGRERLLAEQRLAGGERGVYEVVVGRRRCDDDNRVDVGIVDQRLRVGRDAFEGADAASRLDRFGGEVGDGDGSYFAVFGEQPQRVGVALADHPRADQADTEPFLHVGERTGVVSCTE